MMNTYCKIQFWSLAAPAYSAVMSMLELTWCAQLLFATKPPSAKAHWYPWDFVGKLPDSEVIVRFTVVCFVFQVLWLISSLILIFQIKTPKVWTTMFWICTTVLVTFWSFSTSIYFFVKLNGVRNNPYEYKKSAFNSYFALLLIFSGGFLFWIVNMLLLILLGNKWMPYCIFCPKGKDTRGLYNQLGVNVSSTSSRDFNENSFDIQMEDVVFDAREFRVNKIFHINDEKTPNKLKS